MVGLSIKQIASIESGASYPRAETLAKLCQVFDISPSFLFRNGDENEKENRKIAEHISLLQEKISLLISEEAEYITKNSGNK